MGTAAAAGDGATACSHLSPRGIDQVERLLRDRPEVQATTCAAAVAELAGELPEAALGALREPVVTNVRVEGTRASAQVEPPADLKELALAAGFRDVVAEVRLVQPARRWKVDGGRL